MEAIVRPWQEEDALALHQLAMHPYFSKQRICAYLYPTTFLKSLAMIQFYQQADPARFVYRAILYNQQVCGYLQCEKKKEGCCELSYWLGVQYWHLGIMKEAVNVFCEEVFDCLAVVFIYARVNDKNKASLTLLQKNGFDGEHIQHTYIYRKYR